MVCVLGVKMHWCVHKLEVCCFIWISLVGIFFSFHFISFRLSTFNLIWYKCGIFSPCDVIIFDGSHRMQIDAIYIYLFFNVRCVRLCIITASICSRFPDKKNTHRTHSMLYVYIWQIHSSVFPIAIDERTHTYDGGEKPTDTLQLIRSIVPCSWSFCFGICLSYPLKRYSFFPLCM